MLKPRPSFFATLFAMIVAGLIPSIIRAIFNFEIERFWDGTVLPFLLTHAGAWVATVVDYLGGFWGGVVVTLFVLFCFEMLFAWRRRSRDRPPDTAEPKGTRTVLRLRFSGELEPPQAVAEENVLSWFAYWSPSAEARDQDGNVVLSFPSSWAVFIDFENPVEYRQVAVGFIGGRPHSYEVRQALPTSAVVTLSGGVPACEMEVVTRT